MATVGVLALQGDFREHIAAIQSLAHERQDASLTVVEVRTPEELAMIDALIIPGGESTTIGKLATLYGMMEPVAERVRDGMPVFGTCAGMIMLASGTTGESQPQFSVLDVVVERNAFGRQVESFEADLDVEGFAEAMHAVFIRAPWIEKVGGSVDVLASVTDPTSGKVRPVVVRQGNVLASSFHPELTNDLRLHALLVDGIPADDEAV